MTSYYQNNVPGWGTSQYQFGPPPTPSFHPQPSWGGRDFYNAHAGGAADPSVYEQAWNRARNTSGDPGGVGVGMHEARHWHRRAYGGPGGIAQMQPQEIGHAAAYEAYRSWIHNSSIHEPLSGDVERQREGLVGLAVGEATRLLTYIGRQPDQYTRSIACNAAAVTASILFSHSRDRGEDYRSRSRSRGHGFTGGSSYAASHDPYAYDDALSRGGHRSRSRHGSSRHRSSSRSPSRHRSHSRASPRHQPIIQYTGSNHSYGGGGGGGGIPIPGTSVVVPSYHNSGYGGATPGQYGGVPMTTTGVPMQPSYHGTPMSGVPSYAGSASGMSMGIPQTAMSARPRSSSMNLGYAPSPYMGTGGTMLPAAPQTVYVSSAPKKHKKHRSSHSSSSRHRSRSIDPHYPPVMYASSSRY